MRAKKIKPMTGLFMVLMIGVGLTGCGSQVPEQAKPKLLGQWMSIQQQSVMSLNDDGTFVISRRSETPDEMYGRFVDETDRQRIIFTTNSDQPNCANEVGTYTYRFENNRLLFTKVIDDCIWRENEMIFPWVKIQVTPPEES